LERRVEELVQRYGSFEALAAAINVPDGLDAERIVRGVAYLAAAITRSDFDEADLEPLVGLAMLTGGALYWDSFERLVRDVLGESPGSVPELVFDTGRVAVLADVAAEFAHPPTLAELQDVVRRSPDLYGALGFFAQPDAFTFTDERVHTRRLLAWLRSLADAGPGGWAGLVERVAGVSTPGDPRLWAAAHVTAGVFGDGFSEADLRAVRRLLDLSAAPDSPAQGERNEWRRLLIFTWHLLHRTRVAIEEPARLLIEVMRELDRDDVTQTDLRQLITGVDPSNSPAVAKLTNLWYDALLDSIPDEQLDRPGLVARMRTLAGAGQGGWAGLAARVVGVPAPRDYRLWAAARVTDDVFRDGFSEADLLAVRRLLDLSAAPDSPARSERNDRRRIEIFTWHLLHRTGVAIEEPARLLIEVMRELDRDDVTQTDLRRLITGITPSSSPAVGELAKLWFDALRNAIPIQDRATIWAGLRRTGMGQHLRRLVRSRESIDADEFKMLRELITLAGAAYSPQQPSREQFEAMGWLLETVEKSKGRRLGSWSELQVEVRALRGPARPQPVVPINGVAADVADVRSLLASVVEAAAGNRPVRLGDLARRWTPPEPVLPVPQIAEPSPVVLRGGGGPGPWWQRWAVRPRFTARTTTAEHALEFRSRPDGRALRSAGVPHGHGQAPGNEQPRKAIQHEVKWAPAPGTESVVSARRPQLPYLSARTTEQRRRSLLDALLVDSPSTWASLVKAAQGLAGNDEERSDAAIMDAVVTALRHDSPSVEQIASAAQQIGDAYQTLPASAVDVWRNQLTSLASRHPVIGDLQASIASRLLSSPSDVPAATPPATATDDQVVDPAVERAFLAATDNAGRRSVLIDALPGLGHAAMHALAVFAAGKARTAEDRADAEALRLLAFALSPSYVAGGEPAWIDGLDKVGRFEWSSAVLALHGRLPQSRAALKPLMQTLVTCAPESP
jgi:predicted RNase H-like nuclease